MAEKLAVSLIIGAALQSGFNSVVGGAQKQLNTLGESARNLTGQRKMLDRFQKSTVAIGKTSTDLEQAREGLRNLQAEMNKAPSQKLHRAMEKQRAVVERLTARHQDQRKQLAKDRIAMREAGLSATNMAADYERLGKTIEKLELRQRQLGKAMAARDANLARRGELRSQLIDAVALGAALRAPIMAATQMEEVGVRLSTVVNAADVEGAVRESRRHALNFARSNPVSATDMLNIEYALNSAGLDAQAARLGSTTVAKVAMVTNGAAEQVGEVIATTFNNLGGQLDGSTEERLARIGDLLTKAQFKFQIRDFGQLGESMKYAAPTLAQYNMELAQGLTIIGALNSAGLQGSQAGTSFAAAMGKMSKASEHFGFAMVRGADGQLDFIATMHELSNAIGGFDNMDQYTIDNLQKVFGEQGVRAITLLGQQLKGLSEAQEDVRKGSQGLVDESYARFAATTSAQFSIAKQRVFELGAAIGTVLLPGINSLLGAIGPIISTVAELAQSFPGATTVIVGAVAGLIAMKVAAIGLGYAFTFLKGGWLSLVVGLRTIQAFAATGAIKAFGVALLGMAKTAIPIAIGALKTLTVAMMANPVGLIIGAIALGAALVIRYWEPIKGFFGGLWDHVKASFSDVWETVKTLLGWTPLGLIIKHWEPLKTFFSGLWEGIKSILGGAVEWIGGKVLAPLREARKLLGGAWNAVTGFFGGSGGGTQAEPLTGAAQVVEQAVSGNAGAAPALHDDKRQYTLHIHQQPGEDAESLARRVMDMLRREDDAHYRGALYDTL